MDKEIYDENGNIHYIDEYDKEIFMGKEPYGTYGKWVSMPGYRLIFTIKGVKPVHKSQLKEDSVLYSMWEQIKD